MRVSNRCRAHANAAAGGTDGDHFRVVQPRRPAFEPAAEQQQGLDACLGLELCVPSLHLRPATCVWDAEQLEVGFVLRLIAHFPVTRHMVCYRTAPANQERGRGGEDSVTSAYLPDGKGLVLATCETQPWYVISERESFCLRTRTSIKGARGPQSA